MSFNLFKVVRVSGMLNPLIFQSTHFKFIQDITLQSKNSTKFECGTITFLKTTTGHKTYVYGNKTSKQNKLIDQSLDK